MFYNWNIIGHEKELSRLEEDVIAKKIHHAYLFVGPEKIGKFRVARSAAGILQCPNNFCRSCPTCVQVEKGSHADTILLEDDGESIKINTIRDIISRLNMTGQSRHKILLIKNIGRMTIEASNCLLKTLEEPPQGTVFLFSAGQLRDIIPTIASRMRIIHFKKLQDEVLRASLKKLYPAADEETMNQVLLLSLGRSGSAIQLFAEPEKFQALRELYRQIEFLDEKAGIATRLSSVQELSQDSEKIHTFLSLLTHYMRQKMFTAKSFADKMRAARIIEEIHKTLDLLGRNINARLLLENIMLNI